jgi:threo-3-hydroxy-L-aspartate ammonia-lyase
MSVTLQDIEAAAARLEPYIHHTPLLESATLSRMAGRELRLKAEHLQRGGSFKLRGALNKLLSLDVAQRQQGVVAFSSGNHAQGVALGARILGLPATIVMPSDAPPVKIAATREYGASVVVYDRQTEDREAIARRISDEHGLTLIPPFDDPAIIAGQGTIGLEIARQWPEVENVLVPISGGGLISGIAVALKALLPGVRVIGVEPAVADDARRSLHAGTIVRISVPRTVADGLGAPAIGRLPFAIMRDLVDDIVSVEEDEIMRAVETVLTRAKQVVEPSGAASIAAALERRAPLAGSRVVAIASGGNLALSTLCGWMSTNGATAPEAAP